MTPEVPVLYLVYTGTVGEGITAVLIKKQTGASPVRLGDYMLGSSASPR